MTYCPRYTIEDAMYGRPFVCFQSTWDLVTSPAPPGFRAKAPFRDAVLHVKYASHSSRVIFPSWFRSKASKEPFNLVFSDPSLVRYPSCSSPASLRRSSSLGNPSSEGGG